MAASFPTSAKAFTTKNNGDTVQAAHINDLQAEVTALEQGLLGGAGFTSTAALNLNGSVNFAGQPPTISGSAPRLILTENDRGVDLKSWDAIVDGEVLNLRSLTDALAAVATLITLNRAGDFSALGAHYERGRAAAMGVWTAVAFNAGNFTASAGTWTVVLANQVVFRYMLIGKTLWVNFTINNTNVSNAGVTLQIPIPGGFSCAQQVVKPIQATNAGAASAFGFALVTPAAPTTISLFATAAGGGFGITAANNTNVSGCLEIEIV